MTVMQHLSLVGFSSFLCFALHHSDKLHKIVKIAERLCSRLSLWLISSSSERQAHLSNSRLLFCNPGSLLILPFITEIVLRHLCDIIGMSWSVCVLTNKLIYLCYIRCPSAPLVSFHQSSRHYIDPIILLITMVSSGVPSMPLASVGWDDDGLDW